MNVALLTAAGKGTRMQTEIPKQFLHIRNKPVILYTMEAFQKHPQVDAIMVVSLGSWRDMIWSYARQYGVDKFKWMVEGGEGIHTKRFTRFGERMFHGGYCHHPRWKSSHDF